MDGGARVGLLQGCCWAVAGQLQGGCRAVAGQLQDSCRAVAGQLQGSLKANVSRLRECWVRFECCSTHIIRTCSTYIIITCSAAHQVLGPAHSATAPPVDVRSSIPFTPVTLVFQDLRWVRGALWLSYCHIRKCRAGSSLVRLSPASPRLSLLLSGMSHVAAFYYGLCSHTCLS